MSQIPLATDGAGLLIVFKEWLSEELLIVFYYQSCGLVLRWLINGNAWLYVITSNGISCMKGFICRF